ncbi:MAG TPA: PIG-L family deacetylase [Gemmatimonadaceae bacterium]|nr:PIG-L family deacetylase [Gemmatimonadaceae bacterium]
MKRVVLALVATIVFAAPFSLHAQTGGAVSVPDTRRVLVIGAHPDDEDSQLIAWLQRGGRAETAYLSLTRGDGGQNLIGNELGEALGVIRTEELLAARRVDGAHQYFTRAYDFGFSKSAAETFNHWPKDSLLNDVVKVVRAFRPQIIVAVFRGIPADGHGQHQVSGILAKEAYESAMDTVRFPVSQFGPAWTPSKFYRAAWFAHELATMLINVGEYNHDIGKSYAEIAAESRSQHKSQGFGSLQRKGVVWDYVLREESRVNESTPPKDEKSIFDGITAVPPHVMPKTEEDLRRAVALEAIADRQYVALGDSARVTATIYNRSDEVVNLPQGRTIAPDSAYRWTFWFHGNEITQPYWLVTPRKGDLFSPPISTVSEDQREKRDWVSVSYTTGASGKSVETETAPIVYRYVDPIRGDTQRAIAVAPAISIAFDNTDELARANSSLDRFFNVTLRSAMMKAAPVTVRLTLPSGLTADSALRTVTLDSAGTRTVTFRVHGKLAAGVQNVSAVATSGSTMSRTGYVPIDYDHIMPERIYRPAQVAIHALDISVPAGLRVGYVRGVGDNVEPSLEQLGIPVTTIDPHALPTVDLSKFTTIVVGPRAYQANRDLVNNNSYLLNFAKSGGTLMAQYGQYEMTQPGTMPYAVTLSRPADRVTEENAPINIIDASSPALHRPNNITDADFNGWIQERSLYMPRTFDERYHPVVSLNDPGEPANKGGIMITPYGRGLYVYTTLSFFRQLPAGVSGATRLFVNLLSMTNGAESSRAAGGR